MVEPHAKEDREVREEALGWIVKLTSGMATDADAWELATWRKCDSANEAAYQHAVRLWKQLGAISERYAWLDGRVPERGHAVTRRRMLIGSAVVSASVIGTLVAGEKLGRIPPPWSDATERRSGVEGMPKTHADDDDVAAPQARTN